MKTLLLKFIFWIALLFILMGLLIFVPLSIILPRKITSQIIMRDIRIAHYLTREIQEPLLSNNELTVRLRLEDRLNDLVDAEYIFIQGEDGNVRFSTFKKGIPRGLLDINPLSVQEVKNRKKASDEEVHSVKEFLADGKRVYDIAVPLLSGELGSLHLGVSLDSKRAEIAEFTKINYYVGMIILIGLGVGILIFTLLGLFLSSRIMKLREFAAKIGSGNLEGRISIKTKDELGSLAASFNEMAGHLKEKIEKIKSLIYLEERNRIALEFHDGIAQDLADIIQRLELCERLFKMDPRKAIDELTTLRSNTRTVLNKTRQVIYDLKLPRDSDFNLQESLKNYMKCYESQSGIKVKLDSSGSPIDCTTDKLKNIYYIITEALTNIKKHSLARNVAVQLVSNDGAGIVINIRDDGQGFNVAEAEVSASVSGKWGLTAMRQRAHSLGGDMTIRSAPGLGTDISVAIPFKKEKVQ